MQRHLFATLLTVAFAGHASSNTVINMDEVGADVVATGSGTLNTAALTENFSGPISPSFGTDFLLIGAGTTNAGFWGNISEIVYPVGALSNNGFGAIQATSSSGDAFGIEGLALRLPANYVSGTTLSGTATWSNRTLAGLSAFRGRYVWTWGSGATADSLTLNIGLAMPVPESGTWALMAAGLGFIGWGARCRTRALPRA